MASQPAKGNERTTGTEGSSGQVQTTITEGTQGGRAGGESGAMFLMVFSVIFVLVGIIAWLLHQNRKRSQDVAQKNLEIAIRQFPKTPEEYNDLEMDRWRTSEGWRRFNLRNIAIFSASVMSSFAIVYWHRRRRVALQRRKSLEFWMWTASSALLGSCYGLYLVRESQQRSGARALVKRVRSNPTGRALFYVGLASLVALLLHLARKFYKKRTRAMQKAARMEAARIRRIGIKDNVRREQTDIYD